MLLYFRPHADNYFNISLALGAVKLHRIREQGCSEQCLRELLNIDFPLNAIFIF